ncbi:MAG: phosphocholine cytidylyltransferase family protein [Gammaproteobacteria bacterium]|nr:phosphocholine cytidylyltransferase family protein [Gammaproteobacteria bacterium]
MNKNKQNHPIKAIILAAGVGSRIRPLTDNCPKSLLKVKDKPILEMMINNILDCGITEVILVLGYLQEQIKAFVSDKFPDLDVIYLVNESFADTNTGYSLMLTEKYVGNSAFIKFDADVVFDKNILENLIASDYENCFCIDKNIQLDAEEVKVIINENNQVVKANKSVDPIKAIGESIGIEKISKTTAIKLFSELRLMMEDESNHQEYYEEAYERLIEQQVPFYALDITGSKWIEIDTLEDFSEAAKIYVNDIYH